MDELEELVERQNKFEDSLTEQEKKILELFDFKNNMSCKINGWNMLGLTKGGYSVKIMIGYNKHKKPIFTSSVSLTNWNKVLNFREIIEEIKNKAILSKGISSSSKLDNLL